MQIVEFLDSGWRKVCMALYVNRKVSLTPVDMTLIPSSNICMKRIFGASEVYDLFVDRMRRKSTRKKGLSER